MKPSKRSRNAHLYQWQAKSQPQTTPHLVIPIDIKLDIANVVKTFEFSGWEVGGCCVPRAVIGSAVLHACGLPSRMVVGAMLYRAGLHRRRDTIRFCLPDNRGGYFGGYMIGHAWSEVGDDLIDFSTSDWPDEAERMYEITDDPEDLALGPVEWLNFPPQFIWESSASLKSCWRPRGEPDIGEIWYGGWSSPITPNFSNFDPIVEQASATIGRLVGELHLRERLADRLPSG